MSESILSVKIREATTRQQPKPHIAYEVEIRAAVRTWAVWKRFSEFEDLNKKFLRLFPNHPPPVDLPVKHFFQSTLGNPVLVEERKRGLEDYLQAIQTDPDDRWRETDEWKEFLAIPTGRPLDASTMYTSESWLDEYNQVQAVARDIRTLLNRRETHISRNEVQASHNCGVQAKKNLTTLNTRVIQLDAGLQGLAKGSGRDGHVMLEGELRRRMDMLNDLKNQKETLTKLVLANRPDITKSSSQASNVDRSVLFRQPEVSSARQQLPRTASGSIMTNITASSNSSIVSSNSKPNVSSRRVFGNTTAKMPSETEQTRGLDNEGLLQLQQQTMQDQDLHVEQFSAMLSRQKHIGLAISDELDMQNGMLDELNGQTEMIGDKLRYSQRKIANIH
ncbi:10120_t:CDS:1 [Ambispora gerdemannii]|uniref:10120_t:CDS:1 n=1 Tax=Ambispora gerdemannii TaxID=144530 RepID=A0A9N8WJ66_9GLOM|nr:10120_t:CDS:1 [Ambispora gerdemannii]